VECVECWSGGVLVVECWSGGGGVVEGWSGGVVEWWSGGVVECVRIEVECEVHGIATTSKNSRLTTMGG
jgi:hypothetical protein